MATDEELEAAFGSPRAPPRQHQITEDEWRHLMHVLDRVDRRVGRFSHLCVTVVSFALAWFVWHGVKSEGWAEWVAAIAAFVAFCAAGIIGNRDLDEDDIPMLRCESVESWAGVVGGASP
jgi:hypothetical protein